jgi:hypothetical protein
MKLQDQVITIEQAKRLKELGITGESAFSHFKAASHSGICLGDIGNLRHVWALTGNGYDREGVEFIPAFTVAELGVMLPEWLNIEEKPYRITQWYNEPEVAAEFGGEYRISYRHFAKAPIPQEIPVDAMRGNTEAQTRAAMLIYLLEKASITPEEANTRLLK